MPAEEKRGTSLRDNILHDILKAHGEQSVESLQLVWRINFLSKISYKQ
jgi:hypothetical protein